MDLLMGELSEMSAADESYDAKFKVLTENVEHHIEEEEGDMFPVARKALAGSEDDVGDRMMALKEELTRAPAREAAS